MTTHASGFPGLGRWFGLWVAVLSLPALAAIALGWYWLQGGAGASLPGYWQYAFGGLLALTCFLALVAGVFFNRAVLRPLRSLSRHVEAIASGDLTQRIEQTAASEIGAVHASLRRLQDSLSRLVHGVRNGMAGISSGTQELVAGNADLGSRTEQQASALQQTVVSMEQLSTTVRQNADNARQANQLASMASDVAHRGGSAVGEVVATMNGISDSSQKIADIVGVIDSIAFQTNILALNAAVEAARAGEQGKGFAVVASEVRALAQRSAQAAKEIKTLIEDSVRKVSEGSGQVETAGATMQEIVESVARVTDIMGEISAATTEQASGIEEINRAIASMDEMTRNNASLVQKEALAVSSLDKDVAQVFQAVSGFRALEGQVIDVMASLPQAAPVAAVGLASKRAGVETAARRATAASGAAAQARSAIARPAPANGQKNAALAQSGSEKGAATGTKTAAPARQAASHASGKEHASASIGAVPAAQAQRPPRKPSQPVASDDDWVEF